MMMFPALSNALQSQQAYNQPKPTGSTLGGPGAGVTSTPMNATYSAPSWQSSGNRSAGASNFSPDMQAHIRSMNAQYSPGQGSGMVSPSAIPSMGMKQPGSSLGGPGGYGSQAGPQAAMSDHMSMFKQPSSLGGTGGYSQEQGPQVNQPFGGLRRAMMDRFRPREQMQGRRR